jgi:hypothetical protein
VNFAHLSGESLKCPTGWRSGVAAKQLNPEPRAISVHFSGEFLETRTGLEERDRFELSYMDPEPFVGVRRSRLQPYIRPL